MFGWRRRSEGFEWQEYVRTTILVRRADRQRKIDDVRVAAVNKVKDTADRGVAAGRAGVEQVAQTTSQIITAAARAIGRAIAAAAIAAWRVIASASVAVWRAVAAASASVWQVVRAGASAAGVRIAALPLPKISLPSIRRSDVRPRDPSGASDITPDVGFRLPISPNTIGAAAVVLLLIFLIGPMLNSESTLTPAKFEPAVAARSDTAEPVRAHITRDAAAQSGALSGRATVVKADTLRINGSLVKLAGIEAPEANQPCVASTGRSSNCYASARAALERIVRRRNVTCTALETPTDAPVVANCTADEADIAEALVRNGYVFAASGFFATYGSAESEARAAKAGLWQGDAKRPEEWRKDVWEEAKRAAPDGCPIKGRVRGSGRVYTMPWSDGYDSSQLRTVRGDRWFCSEEEAQSAGFRSADRS